MKAPIKIGDYNGAERLWSEAEKVRGIFISFEGGEGTGKTTQAKLLYDYFLKRGEKVVLTREPGGTKIGERIRKILLDEENKELVDRAEVLLYAAARAQHLKEVVKPALEEGKVVLCDRFFDSTLVYQGEARGIDKKIIAQINQFATEGLTPDLTILLDLPAEVGLKRIKQKSRLDKESRAFHQKVRRGFLRLAGENPQRIKLFKANLNPQSLHLKIVEYVRGVIRKVRQA